MSLVVMQRYLATHLESHRSSRFSQEYVPICQALIYPASFRPRAPTEWRNLGYLFQPTSRRKDQVARLAPVLPSTEEIVRRDFHPLAADWGPSWFWNLPIR